MIGLTYELEFNAQRYLFRSYWLIGNPCLDTARTRFSGEIPSRKRGSAVEGPMPGADICASVHMSWMRASISLADSRYGIKREPSTEINSYKKGSGPMASI